MTTYPSISFKSSPSAYALIDAYVKANKPILLMGSPGVGKTAIVNDIAADLGRKCVVIVASTCDPTDFGGFPVVRDDGAFDRVPMRQIRQAAEEPVVLFLDEISTAPPQVQATLLRGVYERVFGDVTLHPDTVIVAAANPPEQAPGGYEMAAPLIGRFAVYSFEPTLDEVRDYFMRLGDEDSELRELALDFAATTEHAPELVQLDPPQAAVNEGAKWAAPRDWERGLRAGAEVQGLDEDTFYYILAGSVGEHAASGFSAIRKLRQHLPSVGEIEKNPSKAKVPTNPDHQVGALGLLANVASRDCWAAWIYAARLDDEISAAAARALLNRDRKGATKHSKAGKKAMITLLGRIGRDLGGME